MADRVARESVADIRALSLTQPWAWVVCHLGKTIENRSRNIGNYRGPVLIHASKGMTDLQFADAWGFVAGGFGLGATERIPAQGELTRGAIVGLADIVGRVGPDEPLPPGFDPRWRMHGQHAYLLRDPRPLVRPIPCKGALGFWRPPAEVLAEVFGT